MKVEAKQFPSLLQTSKSAASSLKSHLGCLLVLFSLVAGGMADKAQAAPENSRETVRKLAQSGVTCPKYVEAVVALVKGAVKDYLDSPKGKTNPDGQYDVVNDIIAEAVKSKPPCACEIVKAGIQEVTPLNTAPDPKIVASLVAEVVQYIQATNPEMLESIITCATEAAPDSGRAILNAVAGILSITKGTVNRLNVTMPNGVSFAAPTPVPQVTPVTPP